METSFVSAVIYVGKSTAPDASALTSLVTEVEGMFKTYEIVLVDDSCDRGTLQPLVDSLKGKPCSIVHMGIPQGVEAAMNAGVDAGVGDYVFEIDDLMAFDPSFVSRAYAEVGKGADIVNGIPASGASLRGRLFYLVFNHFSNYPSKLASNPYRLVSRRAINRIRSMSDYAPYRKASFAACGLKVADVSVKGNVSAQTGIGVAITSLALYTDAFYRIAFWLAAAMAVLSLAELIYVIVIAVSGIAITGWVTTMFVLTVGFLGIFILLAFALKYLDILVNITFVRQGYLTDGIERPRE